MDETPVKVEVMNLFSHVFTINLLHVLTVLINRCRMLLLRNELCFHLKISQLKRWIRLLIRLGLTLYPMVGTVEYFQWMQRRDP